MDPNLVNYQQDIPSPDAAAALGGIVGLILGGFLLFFIVLFLVYYIFYAISLMRIAKKTGTPNGWLAWIPVANIVLMVQISGKPLWWIILFFIPIANIIAIIMVWMAIAEKLGKPNWLGILMILPPADLIALGYLAFSKGEDSEAPAPPVSTPQAPIQ